MDRQLDHHIQRIVQNAASYDLQNGPSTVFNQEERNPAEWRFAPGPSLWQSAREPSSFSNNFGLDLGDTSHPLPAPSTIRTRVSFPPQIMYSQPQSAPEPGMISNANNHFRFAQNLRNGMPRNQAPPRQNNVQSMDPVSPLATAMLMQQTMPVRQHIEQNLHQTLPFSQAPSNLDNLHSMETTGPSALDTLSQHPIVQRHPSLGYANFFQGLQANRLSQLQLQRQQVTPPFNLGGFAGSPTAHQASQSSSPVAGQGSSPSARVILRRASNRTATAFGKPETDMDMDIDVEEHIEIPQTPQQRSTYPTTKFTSRPLSLSHAPPMAHGIQLISPHELPDRFRQVFPYELFNAAQSKCFAPIYKTNDNVVVSAPTGSGKTALLELAICRVVESYDSGQFKIVYQAPTKSLCSERVRDWQKKFSHLNLPCAELTGDTSQAEMARVRNATIIVTTPEKWDSITRKWSDHQKLVQMVKLFLIDEVHILKDARGATLEAVVSRMKTMGANVRFVALSATVPNSEDIARWLGRDHTNPQIPARQETFGEEFRPVRLQKHVHGYDGNFNDFAFEKILDGKLPGLIRQYSQKKPIMIFCFTRKSCEATASILAEWWRKQSPTDRAWSARMRKTVVNSKDLGVSMSSGVAFHHAGLEPQDRHAVETAFLEGDIDVICCTSTLAVGVNLPCHLVVLKGTVGFQDGRLTEYSDLEVMQMLGRAGRPQFDDSAVAVIMTRTDKVDQYKKMVSGQDVLESTLHLNLIEHLNSEVSLGTIKNVYDAKRWLCGTFLSVRMRQNPKYYKINGVSPGGDADRRLEQVCERDIKLLQEYQLVSNEERMSCTEYGAAMSRYMVQFETMKLLLSIPSQAKTEQIFHVLCQAAEFRDLRMKPNERSFLREFNKSPFIKFPIRGTITTTPHKVSLLIQVQLGGADYPNDKDFMVVKRQFGTDKAIVFERIQRLIRCVIDCKVHDCDSTSTRHALDLARSLSAEFWEYSNLQLRQIPQVGPVATRKLVNNNVHSIEELGKMDTGSIERIMSKNPPFGRKTKDLISGFPILKLNTEIVGRVLVKQKKTPQIMVKARMWYENKTVPIWQGRKPSLTFMAETTDGKLVHFWRGNISKLERDFDVKFSVELSAPEVEIKCWISCDGIVGTVKTCILQHNISASEFPPTPPRVEAKKNTQKGRGNGPPDTADEFGTDEVEDYEMLAVVNTVETAKMSDYGSDDFIDIDDAELLAKAAEKPKKAKETEALKESEILEPFQMANGKWTCNHICRDGQLLKSGHPCKHLCCRVGLDKPRRIKRNASLGTAGSETSISKKTTSKAEVVKPRAIQKSQPKLKVSSSDFDELNLDDVEVIDLAKELSPVPYGSLAPREYRKLHKIQISVQEDKSSQRLTQKPQLSFVSGESPDLPFFEKNGHASTLKDLNDEDENEFPSPSALLGFNEDPYYFGSDPIADDIPVTPRDQLSAAPAPPSPFHDDSMESLEAGMLEFSDPMTLKTTTPRVGSSFCNDLFDFAAFENNFEVHDKVPSSSSDKNQVSSSTVDNATKRPLSASPALPEAKHRRVTDVEPAAESSVPAWVNDFDSKLIDELKDFVDFVD